jgi:hypothetical protein
MKTVIEQGQNLYDVVVQCYGSAEAVFKLVEENGLTSLNTDLDTGATIVYDWLPVETSDALPNTREVQKHYDLKEVRVRTGEVAYIPKTNCTIPEGYVMYQFSITQIEKQQVLYFDWWQEGYLQPQDIYDPVVHIGLLNNWAANPVQAAMLMVQWVNTVLANRGLFATSTQNTVTMYIPKLFLSPEGNTACGWHIPIYFYQQIDVWYYGNTVFQTVQSPEPVVNFNYLNGLTQCCNTIADGDNEAMNHWMTQSPE